MNSLREFQITTPSGVTLDCAAQGPARGVPLLLLHGYSDSWRSYRPLLAALPASLRAIAISQRGHGDSSKPDTTYAVSDFAGDVAELMDALGIARAVVVGHSMGSLVARHLAEAFPDRVESLVLIGTFRATKGNAGAEELWREAVAPMVDPVDPAFVRDFQESTLARPVAPDFLVDVIAESRKLPARVWQRALRAMLDMEPDDARRIAAPTLILWGDQDTYCSRDDQRLLVEAIPISRLSVIEGAGHSPHWEDPGHVAAEIAAFLQETNRKAA